MSSNNEKGKRIDSWNLSPVHRSDGKVGVEANIRYTDGSSGHESLGIFPKDSNEKSAGRVSVAEILTNLDNMMKEKQRQQQEQNKGG
jgi:hypothetical protein